MIKLDGKYKRRDGESIRRVLTVDVNNMCPILVEMPNGHIYQYTPDGKYFINGESHLDLIEVSPYEDFKIDDPVMVRDYDSDRWIKRYFAGISDSGLALTFTNGATCWSVDDLDDVLTWGQCRRPTEEELKGVSK